MSDSASPRNWLSRLTSKSTSSSPPDGVSAKERRREQVRQAQRTHRDRKTSYYKSLETELATLRQKTGALEFKCNSQDNTIRQLSSLLTSYGIQLPSEISLDTPEQPQALMEVYHDQAKNQNIRATLPADPSFQSHYPVSFQDSAQNFDFNTTENHQTSPFDIFNSGTSGNEQRAVLAPQAASPPDTFHPEGLNHPQIAIDFVLSLEQPCLHHHGHSPSSDDGDGHHAMLQAPILQRYPYPSPPGSTSPELQLGQRWDVPSHELQNLLELSDSLALDGEITPVRVWHQISTHVLFHTLKQSNIEQLKSELLVKVQCFGFGAVIDASYFDSTLQQMFALASRTYNTEMKYKGVYAKLQQHQQAYQS